MLLILSTKGELLNSFSAEQCSIIENRSKSGTGFVTQTDQFHAPITFSQDNILKIIQSLNPEKSHGPKKISVDMIKLCGISLWKPPAILNHVEFLNHVLQRVNFHLIIRMLM